ncbi:MAG TPA: hypothetical protein PKM27_01260 [Saprospiraceae bacterium]|nr:hypothetical protein [Saprospiraceae bacterium]HNT19173.1 hypothetical protein [Saprospiraceae bacterium]
MDTTNKIKVMDFNELISEKLGLIFQKHHLIIIEQSINHMKLKSDKVVILFNYNEKEKSQNLYVGKKDDLLYAVDEYVLKNAFNSDLKINNVTPDTFAKNLCTFFNGRGKPLIAGNKYALSALEKYVYKEGEIYTMQLLVSQKLDAATKAWEERNYKDFVNFIDQIDKRKLAPSYKIRYKMAINKLNSSKKNKNI